MPAQRPDGTCTDCGFPHRLGTVCPLYKECCGVRKADAHADWCPEGKPYYDDRSIS